MRLIKDPVPRTHVKIMSVAKTRELITFANVSLDFLAKTARKMDALALLATLVRMEVIAHTEKEMIIYVHVKQGLLDKIAKMTSAHALWQLPRSKACA